MDFSSSLNQLSVSVKKSADAPFYSLFLRSFLAGAYIAMGVALMIAVSVGVGSVLGFGIEKVLSGFAFPLGLILVLVTGGELFTGSVMFSPFALQDNYVKVIRLWLITLCGNIIGALFFAGLMTYGVLLTAGPDGTLSANAMTSATVSLAVTKYLYPGIHGFISCFLKAIACGWLLSLAVLISFCSEDLIGKIAGIWICGFTIAATGMEHLISNLYIIPAGLFTAGYLSPFEVAAIGPEVGLISYSGIFVSLLPVLIGNVIGALVFGYLLVGKGK